MITMEKIDYVISVTGAEYGKVREALLSCDGDVDRAIRMIMGEDDAEKEQNEQSYDFKNAKRTKMEDMSDSISNFGSEIIDAVRDFWEKGNATKLDIMDEHDEVILNVSMNLGAIWTVIAPVAALMGVGIGILSRWEFYIYLDDGRVVNVKDYITDKHRMR